MRARNRLPADTVDLDVEPIEMSVCSEENEK